jgi:hypothetical protein
LIAIIYLPFAVCLDNAIPNPCLALSVGVGGLPDFETIMADKYHCHTHSFDPTISEDSWMVQDIRKRTNSQFHLLGLSNVDDETNAKMPVMSLHTMRKKLLTDAQKEMRLSVLKVDCEGCEWDALTVDDDDGVSIYDGVDQVMFEFHMGSGGFDIRKGANMFRKLHKEGFRMFYRNFNPWSTGAVGTEPLGARLEERHGKDAADQYRCTKESMIRMGKDAGYGWMEADYELWKHHVQPNRVACCFEVGFIRV